MCAPPTNVLSESATELAAEAASPSESSLHSEACNALGASDGVIHTSISLEVVNLRATANKFGRTLGEPGRCSKSSLFWYFSISVRLAKALAFLSSFSSWVSMRIDGSSTINALRKRLLDDCAPFNWVPVAQTADALSRSFSQDLPSFAALPDSCLPLIPCPFTLFVQPPGEVQSERDTLFEIQLERADPSERTFPWPSPSPDLLSR